MAPRSIARQAVPRYTPSRYVTCSSGFRDRRRRTTWWNSRACRRAFTRCEPLVALCPNRTGRSSVFASAVLHSSYSLSWRPPWYSVTDGRRPSLWRCGFEKMWKAAGDTGETAAANHVATEWHIFHVTYGYRCTYRSNAHDPAVTWATAAIHGDHHRREDPSRRLRVARARLTRPRRHRSRRSRLKVVDLSSPGITLRVFKTQCLTLYKNLGIENPSAFSAAGVHTRWIDGRKEIVIIEISIRDVAVRPDTWLRLSSSGDLVKDLREFCSGNWHRRR